MPPIDHELNLTTQAVLTDLSWGLTALLLVIAIRMGLRERTPFYALMVLGALVGAFAEPLYDVAMMLYFYSTPGMWTHFTAFDIPQPIWTHSGYVVLYAAPSIYIARQIARGLMTRHTLFVWSGITLFESAAFEIVGINGGLYSYWGPHVFRIFQYPLVIGVLEAAQVSASRWRHRSCGPAAPVSGSCWASSCCSRAHFSWPTSARAGPPSSLCISRTPRRRWLRPRRC